MYKNVVVTEDFKSSNDKYCKLFKTYTNTRNGEKQYNDIQMIFNLTNISSTGTKKDYDRYLFTTSDGNTTLIRLSTEQTRLKVGYTIENKEISVYCYGGSEGARTYLNIEYVTNKSYFTFYETSIYIYSPSNIILATENYEYSKRLVDIQPNTYKVNLQTSKYNEILKVTNYNNIQPLFTVSFMITEIPTGTLTGNTSIYNVCSFNGKTTISRINGFFKSNRINVSVVKNIDNSVSVYLTSTEYGTYIITPLTFYTENAYINYVTTNTNITSYEGILLEKSPFTSEYKWDSTNNKPCWFNGTNWVYADGTQVP